MRNKGPHSPTPRIATRLILPNQDVLVQNLIYSLNHFTYLLQVRDHTKCRKTTYGHTCIARPGELSFECALEELTCLCSRPDGFF